MNSKTMWQLWSLTGLAMLAFAANSILGRAALRSQNEIDLIDPASYTAIRIASGAIVLYLIQSIRAGRFFWIARPLEPKGSVQHGLRNWISPLMLAVYAGAFSFAYISLDTASGTLILFALVQITMLTIGIINKEFPSGIEVAGLVLASAGLVYLVLPNLQTPLIKESILMAIAGIAWGSYSVLGKKSKDSIANTATNFTLGTPIVLSLPVLLWSHISVTVYGTMLAVLSGAIASGMGYVLWYLVLPSLRSAQAAAVQLSVPIIAAIGGVVLVGDELNLRILASGFLILLGIGLTVKWKKSTTTEAKSETKANIESGE